jgi:PIN domain nuclease of toxin-antitoxin system
MRLLLDTHTLVWWSIGDRRLSQAAARAISEPANDVAASPVNAMEIALKYRLRRLPELTFSPVDLAAMLERARIRVLEINFAHALDAGSLKIDHRDPWDRLLIAQARLDNRTVVTRDAIFAAAGVPVLW